MKTDGYTKWVLTVIAGALLFLCADRLQATWIPQAKAHGDKGKWECWHLTDPDASLTDIVNASRVTPGTVFSIQLNTNLTKGSVSDTFCGWVP